MDRGRGWTGRRLSLAAVGRAVALAFVLAGAVGPALAHGGALGRVARESPAAPGWLVAGVGVAAVAAAVAATAVAPDRASVAARVFRRSRPLPLPGERALRAFAGLFGVAVLVGVVLSGLVGPTDPLSSPAVLVVWVGWWAGFAASTYLVGNAWPAVNPWRALAGVLPGVGRTYRWRWGAWPSVAALLALVWLEIVSPLTDRPRTLAVTVLAYTVVTLAGAVVYGRGVWFGEVDPVSRVFRLLGRVAPLGTDGDGLELRFPGSALADDALAGRDEAAFVVALLWVTVFDGLVATSAWATVARAAVGAGLPPGVVYLAALVAGAGAFWGLYLLAVRLAARTTPVPAATLARRFAPPLLAVAAGVHLAHYLPFFLALLPPLALAVTAPMATVEPLLVAVPDWFGGVSVAAVLAGHALAVLAARTVAVEVSERQSIRMQYPFVAATVAYTAVALWVVTRPGAVPPFV